MTGRLPAALAMFALISCVAPARAATDCTAQLQEAMIARSQQAQRTRDDTLYVRYYLCLGYSTAEARAFAKLRVQLVEAARAVLEGRMAPKAYSAFLIDRQRKADLMRTSPGYAKAIARGDADNDLVPDSMDFCRNTPPGAPTDASGCDLRCPPATAVNVPRDPACLATVPPPYSAESGLRPLLEATVPVNLSCTDATPASSTLIAWGSRTISRVNGLPFPREIDDSRSGYYFSVRRSDRQPPGCEVWYALQFAFRNPSSANAPPIDVVSVLFNEKEDESGGGEISRFPLLTHHGRIEGDLSIVSEDLPLSPGRARLRDALKAYSDVSVRVRVITGGPQPSSWSPYVGKTRGPEIRDVLPL